MERPKRWDLFDLLLELAPDLSNRRGKLERKNRNGAAPTEDREERSVRSGVEPGMALPICAFARKPPDRLFVFQCSKGKGVANPSPIPVICAPHS